MKIWYDSKINCFGHTARWKKINMLLGASCLFLIFFIAGNECRTPCTLNEALYRKSLKTTGRSKEKPKQIHKLKFFFYTSRTQNFCESIFFLLTTEKVPQVSRKSQKA